MLKLVNRRFLVLREGRSKPEIQKARKTGPTEKNTFRFGWRKNTWATMDERMQAVIDAKGQHTKYQWCSTVVLVRLLSDVLLYSQGERFRTGHAVHQHTQQFLE